VYQILWNCLLEDYIKKNWTRVAGYTHWSIPVLKKVHKSYSFIFMHLFYVNVYKMDTNKW